MLWCNRINFKSAYVEEKKLIEIKFCCFSCIITTRYDIKLLFIYLLFFWLFIRFFLFTAMNNKEATVKVYTNLGAERLVPYSGLG